jgi:hypothetical protein
MISSNLFFFFAFFSSWFRLLDGQVRRDFQRDWPCHSLKPFVGILKIWKETSISWGFFTCIKLSHHGIMLFWLINFLFLKKKKHERQDMFIQLLPPCVLSFYYRETVLHLLMLLYSWTCYSMILDSN